MYVAMAGFNNRFIGDDLDKMKNLVDAKNEESSYNKFCLIELNDWDYGLYKKNKNLYGCHPVVIYDPAGVSQRVLRSKTPDFNFVRNFGGKSRD